MTEISKMETFHNQIRRLSMAITNKMDDLNRFISQQYMNKKITQLRAKQRKNKSQAESKVEERIRNRNLELNEGHNYSTLLESNHLIHNFGKIQEMEKNFQNLKNQSNQKSNELENGNSQNHEVL